MTALLSSSRRELTGIDYPDRSWLNQEEASLESQFPFPIIKSTMVRAATASGATPASKVINTSAHASASALRSNPTYFRDGSDLSPREKWERSVRVQRPFSVSKTPGQVNVPRDTCNALALAATFSLPSCTCTIVINDSRCSHDSEASDFYKVNSSR